MKHIEFHIKEPSKIVGALASIWAKGAYWLPAVACNVAFDSWYSYPSVYGIGFCALVADAAYNEKKILKQFSKLDSWFKKYHEKREESVRISKLLRDSFMNANLVMKEKNGVDQVVTFPDVIIGKDQYNYYLQVHMLPGQTTEQWKNKASIFGNALGCNLVKHEIKKGLLQVVLQHTEVQADGISYKKDDEHVLELGRWAGGELRWEFDKEPHMLIVGMTGTGKSTFLRNLFVQFQRDWEISIVDGKFVEFNMLKKYGFHVASDESQFKEVIENAWLEVNRRFKLLEQAEKNHYSQLDLPPYFLVVDEFISVAESYGSKKNDKVPLWSQLKDIAVRGRAAGVSMILILQRPDSEYLPTLVRDNMAAKVVLGAASETAYEMGFGAENKKLTPLEMGEGYAQLRSDLVNFGFPNYELEKFLEDMQWSRRESRTVRPEVANGSADETA